MFSRIFFTSLFLVVCASRISDALRIDEAFRFPKFDLRRWPQVVGMTVQQAEDVIRKDFPEVYFQVLNQGSPVTLDLRSNRVRLFVNDKGIVVDIPYNT